MDVDKGGCGDEDSGEGGGDCMDVGGEDIGSSPPEKKKGSIGTASLPRTTLQRLRGNRRVCGADSRF